MTTILVFATLLTGPWPTDPWSAPSPHEHLDGRATYMAPGVMAEVVANRGMDLSGFVSGVALNRAGDLGRAVWLTWADGTTTGPHLVTDCAQRRHLQARLDANYIVEVDAKIAQARGFYGVGPVPVRVSFSQPNTPLPAGPPGRWEGKPCEASNPSHSGLVHCPSPRRPPAKATPYVASWPLHPSYHGSQIVSTQNPPFNPANPVHPDTARAVRAHPVKRPFT